MEARYKAEIYSKGKDIWEDKKIEFTQYDSETGIIEMTMYNDFDKPMTDIFYASLTIVRPNGDTFTYGGSDGVNPYDCFVVDGNVVTLTMPPGSVYAVGKHKATVAVYGEGMKRLTAAEFDYVVKKDYTSDVPLDESDNYMVLTDLINRVEAFPAKEDGWDANEATRQAQEANRELQEDARELAAQQRETDFLAIKAEYETATMENTNIELVNARKGKANLREKMDEIDSTLNNNAISLNKKLEAEKQFQLALEFVKDGFFVLIGDSVTDGFGLLNYADQYPSKLFTYIKNILGNVNDQELTVNFESNNNIGKLGSWAINDNGAARKSIILQPGAAVYFTGDLKYIDIIFKRTPTSGKIDVYRNGTVIKTIDCSGVDAPIVSSFPTATVPSGSANYTLSCTTNPVELLGVIRINTLTDKLGNTFLMRAAFSGADTADFSTDKVLSDIKGTLNSITGSGRKKNKLYIIVLGINDIVSSSKNKPSDAYITNLDKIYTKLKEPDCDVRIMFVVPPISDVTLFPIRQETYNAYKDKLILLARKYNAGVIDFSYIDFVANSYYQDGVHPNAAGTTAMVDHIIKTLSLGIPKGDEKIVSNCVISATNKTLTNSIVNTVSFDTASPDNCGYFNSALPTIFTIPADGVYSFTVNYEYASNTTGRRCIWLLDNLSNYFGHQYVNGTTGGTTNSTYTHIGYFKAGQTIKCQIIQSSGADLVLNTLKIIVTKLS